MEVGQLDHYNVSTRKLKETVEFYEAVLGFKNGPRPPFNFPGAWLYSGNHPVLHLNDIAGTDKEQRPIPASSITSRSAAAASRR
jgi:catechol 2,3-dioxygenase-like lactoylglutathione lyase family enzyme